MIYGTLITFIRNNNNQYQNHNSYYSKLMLHATAVSRLMICSCIASECTGNRSKAFICSVLLRLSV